MSVEESLASFGVDRTKPPELPAELSVGDLLAEHDRGHETLVYLTHCPICYTPFEKETRVAPHIHRYHGPEDLGLEPIGEPGSRRPICAVCLEPVDDPAREVCETCADVVDLPDGQTTLDGGGRGDH